MAATLFQDTFSKQFLIFIGQLNVLRCRKGHRSKSLCSYLRTWHQHLQRLRAGSLHFVSRWSKPQLKSLDSFVFITLNLWSSVAYLAGWNWISLQNYASEQKDTCEILQDGHVPDVVVVRVHSVMTNEGEKKEDFREHVDIRHWEGEEIYSEDDD